MIRLLLLFTGIVAWIIIYIPPFERIVYNESEVTGYEDTFVYGGYKAGPETPRYTCIDDLEEKQGGTIETDVANFQPTGVFMNLHHKNVMAYKHVSIFKRATQNWGQLYEVKLESGEKILVLIDDYMVKLPSEGKVVLPVCGDCEDIDISVYNSKYESYDSYWDFASQLAKSDEMDWFRDKEEGYWCAIYILIILIVLVVDIESRKRKKRLQNKENLAA